MKKIIPFDIEKAKNGAEVINMLGEKIKIIYYDVKSCYPIVGLRFDKTTVTEIVNTYTKEGKYIDSFYSSDQDLQIVEEVITYDEIFERKYKLLCYFANKNLQPVEEVITYEKIIEEIIEEIIKAINKNTNKIEKFKAIELLFKIANYYNKEKINWESVDQKKYYICYDEYSKNYDLLATSKYHSLNPVFIDRVSLIKVLDNPIFKIVLDSIFLNDD